MASDDDSTSRLLALPDSCLLAVMQRCADDAGDMLLATTAHSRLHQAAVAALSRISAIVFEEHRIDSLLLYLAKHGQHVRSLVLGESKPHVQLQELPPTLTKLNRLELENVNLQLQAGLGGAQGVLRAEFPLTRLELDRCGLLDGTEGLAAALVQLPDLQHLSLDVRPWDDLVFPTTVLSHLTKLTSLKLQQVECPDGNSSSNVNVSLQPLQALMRLADLQLGPAPKHAVTADSLSRADQLTRLVLFRQRFEPHTLAGKTQLQVLILRGCSFVPGAGVAQLLSELQHLTRLTHLDLDSSCRQRGVQDGPSPPPAAYASLTASSRLQHLDFRSNTLPSAAWQYMCPPGRTLPHLQYLDISDVKEADGSLALPATNALVRCCPSLQTLFTSMPCSTAQLAPLQQLTGLTSLTVGAGEDDELEGVQELCQLTGLQGLHLVPRAAEARILQLTQLTRLTCLFCMYNTDRSFFGRQFFDPEPVWHQLLRKLSNSQDPEVAQQAAAGLAATQQPHIGGAAASAAGGS